MALDLGVDLRTLDLHGYKIADVAQAVDRALMQAQEARQTHLRIMTGKGSGKVQAEVLRILREGHYPWEYEKLPSGKRNEGVLLIHLD